MTRAELLPLVRDIAKIHQLDYRLVDAIIQTESSYDVNAVRFEPKCTYEYSYKFFASILHVTPETELNFQRCSWGLVQIMGFVAREQGFKEPLHQLCVPKINIEMGCRVMAKNKAKYPLLSDQIAAYNSGSPIKAINGGYKNQAYVDRVLTIYRSPL